MVTRPSFRKIFSQNTGAYGPKIQRDLPFYIPTKEEIEELYEQGSLISREAHNNLKRKKDDAEMILTKKDRLPASFCGADVKLSVMGAFRIVEDMITETILLNILSVR